MQPSPVITLNRAVTVSELRGAEEALAMIVQLEERLGGYFYFFGVKGAFLAQMGRTSDARTAFNQAIALAHSPEEAANIRQHLDRLIQEA